MFLLCNVQIKPVHNSSVSQTVSIFCLQISVQLNHDGLIVGLPCTR